MFERPLCSEEGRGLQNSSRHTIDAKGVLVLKASHIQTVAPEGPHLCLPEEYGVSHCAQTCAEWQSYV